MARPYQHSKPEKRYDFQELSGRAKDRADFSTALRIRYAHKVYATLFIGIGLTLSIRQFNPS
jgi:hypothetical protein